MTLLVTGCSIPMTSMSLFFLFNFEIIFLTPSLVSIRHLLPRTNFFEF